MLYLATASGPLVREAMGKGLLAQMLTYKAGNALVPGAAFAVDNGVVKIVGGRPVTDPEWNSGRWLTMLRRYAPAVGCLFAVVPDVVCDAEATDARWTEWAPDVVALGYRPAYVLQNGCTAIPDNAGAVFTGGDDAWKVGDAARRLVVAAKRRGLWCHMGRVNTLSRLRLAADHGYDSVDGTCLAWGPDKNLPIILRFLRQIHAQPSLGLGALA